MKLKKVTPILSILLICSILFSSSVFANPNSDEPGDYKNTYENGKRVVAVHRVTEKGLVKLSEEEYNVSKRHRDNSVYEKNIMKNDMILNNGIQPFLFAPYSSYYESGVYYNQARTDLQKMACSYVANTTNNVAGINFSCSATQSFTSNFSLTSAELKGFKMDASITFSSSMSSSQAVTGNISPKHRGWVEFYPIMDNSFGVTKNGYYTSDYQLVITEEKFTDIYVPKKVNGLLFGEYIVYESRL